MTSEAGNGRVDQSTRLISADPSTIYAAFVDPAAWLSWLPPEGMSGEIVEFNAVEGGGYQLILRYEDGSSAGKSSADTDIARGTFIELVPNQRLVQDVIFESDDPAFSGIMRMSWIIEPEGQSTLVTMRAEHVPVGISAEDHQMGMQSTLANLARYVEGTSS